MFTLSAKADYGLTAVMELALRASEGPIQIRELAERHAIPQHYLEQLLVALKRKEIVKSYRGAHGGYALAAAPSEITALEVFEALDGTLQLLPEKRRESPIAFFTKDVERAVRHALSVSLADLLAMKQNNDNRFIYTI